MGRQRPRVERDEDGAVAAADVLGRECEELIDLVDGAHAAAGEEAALGHRRAGDGGERVAFARAQERLARVTIAEACADLVKHWSNINKIGRTIQPCKGSGVAHDGKLRGYLG